MRDRNTSTDPTTNVPIWARRFYRPAQFTVDLLVLTAVFVATYAFRFEFQLDAGLRRAMVVQLPFVVFAQFAALLLSGAHHRSWRYTNIQDLPTFLRAAFYSTSVILGVRLAPIDVFAPLRIPLSIIAVDALFAFGGVLAVRIARRTLDELRKRRSRSSRTNGELEPVILVGAGRAGVLAVRELDREGIGMDPVAFVDDDPLKRNSVIAGVRVLGTTEDLPALVDAFEVEQVVVTIADMAPARKKRILAICESIPVKVREIPGYYEVLQGKVALTRFRVVEPESLLEREPVHLDEVELERWLKGARVLLTGAGGSIGSELGRQIARCEPEVLALVERSEHALFEIRAELGRRWPGVRFETVLADVADERRMRQVFADCRPTLVAHSAAHKHVTMMELQPSEAVKNNILGTRCIGRIAGEYEVEHFILISSDKAVNPSSVMGASKRVAELVIQDLDQRYRTRYSAVRFGNVLGSAGSVLPIFEQQIKDGGPVTVTDPDMKRYFMSIPEAAQLVLRAGSMARGGEIFVLDMGEPVRILDLAEKMIRLSGFEPYEEIEIEIIGRRRGEKLFEELGQKEEDLSLTRNPKIFIGKLAPCPPDELEKAVRRLAHLADSADGEAIRECLNDFLPEAALELRVDMKAPVG